MPIEIKYCAVVKGSIFRNIATGLIYTIITWIPMEIKRTVKKKVLLNNPAKTLFSEGRSFLALISLKICKYTQELNRKAQWRDIPGFLTTSLSPVILHYVSKVFPTLFYAKKIGFMSDVLYPHSYSLFTSSSLTASLYVKVLFAYSAGVTQISLNSFSASMNQSQSSVSSQIKSQTT